MHNGGLNMPKLCVINDESPNASATYLIRASYRRRNLRLVADTKQERVEGVIAHELSHIGNKDILILPSSTWLICGSSIFLANFFPEDGETSRGSVADKSSL